MMGTLISLISVLMGIVGGNSISVIFKNYSFGLIGNTIAGVFGSIFILKTFGRLGFDPKSIIQYGNVDYLLLVTNLATSFISGGGFVVLISILKSKTSDKTG